ncbi:hypothetical protein NP233_g12175 [Leucocoprinus birnbaumii]|uniref:Uncharacterized protein n=1 Tax=Leucocoprinus birnbaumii TaxID=56174 RepID=A0AAD5YKN7_9AGAR|nr:hypothetical protein NP233_g12175 [Leucocoprinus birnbaumii]
MLGTLRIPVHAPPTALGLCSGHQGKSIKLTNSPLPPAPVVPQLRSQQSAPIPRAVETQPTEITYNPLQQASVVGHPSQASIPPQPQSAWNLSGFNDEHRPRPTRKKARTEGLNTRQGFRRKLGEPWLSAQKKVQHTTPSQSHHFPELQLKLGLSRQPCKYVLGSTTFSVMWTSRRVDNHREYLLTQHPRRFNQAAIGGNSSIKNIKPPQTSSGTLEQISGQPSDVITKIRAQCVGLIVHQPREMVDTGGTLTGYLDPGCIERAISDDYEYFAETNSPPPSQLRSTVESRFTNLTGLLISYERARRTVPNISTTTQCGSTSELDSPLTSATVCGVDLTGASAGVSRLSGQQASFPMRLMSTFREEILQQGQQAAHSEHELQSV